MPTPSRHHAHLRGRNGLENCLLDIFQVGGKKTKKEKYHSFTAATFNSVPCSSQIGNTRRIEGSKLVEFFFFPDALDLLDLSICLN